MKNACLSNWIDILIHSDALWMVKPLLLCVIHPRKGKHLRWCLTQKTTVASMQPSDCLGTTLGDKRGAPLPQLHVAVACCGSKSVLYPSDHPNEALNIDYSGFPCPKRYLKFWLDHVTEGCLESKATRRASPVRRISPREAPNQSMTRIEAKVKQNPQHPNCETPLPPSTHSKENSKQ